MFEKRVREQYGLEINAGPFGIDSRPALIADKYAESQGKGDVFHKAVMDAYWQQARSIDDKIVLKEIAEHVGLNTENFEAILNDQTYNTEVSADIDLARGYRLDGVPALIFAERNVAGQPRGENVGATLAVARSRRRRPLQSPGLAIARWLN